jgi:hypothetical protein
VVPKLRDICMYVCMYVSIWVYNKSVLSLYMYVSIQVYNKSVLSAEVADFLLDHGPELAIRSVALFLPISLCGHA